VTSTQHIYAARRRMGVSEPVGGDAELNGLRADLVRRDEVFERDRGEKSSRAHIAADPAWEAVYQSLKRAERIQAESSRVRGQCAQYIARRRRFCASRAADGRDGYCSLHASDLGRALSRPDASGAVDGHETSAVAAAHGPDGEIVRSIAERRAEDATSKDVTSKDATSKDATSKALKPMKVKKTNVHRRMKKLTNPMSAHHRNPTEAPKDWSEVFSDLTLPVVVDVGCAKGRFLQRCATVDRRTFQARAGGKHNLLGLEMYAPIVEEAARWTEGHDLDGEALEKPNDGLHEQEFLKKKLIRNLHFVACNATVTLSQRWLGALSSNVAWVTILFPDPWSRKKHAGRRVVTSAFVDVLAGVLRKNGKAYCCSDVKPLAEEMYAAFLGKGTEAPFAIDEATYAELGEASDVELETRCCAGLEGGARPPGEAVRATNDRQTRSFEHVFPAHAYEWQPAPGIAGETALHTTADANKTYRWLASNPMGIPTERDLVCESKWRPVYRFVVARKERG